MKTCDFPWLCSIARWYHHLPPPIQHVSSIVGMPPLSLRFPHLTAEDSYKVIDLGSVTRALANLDNWEVALSRFPSMLVTRCS